MPEKLTVFFMEFVFSQAMYREEHMFGVFPVELNDVIVGITMLIASLIQVGQCVVYDVRITIWTSFLTQYHVDSLFRRTEKKC